MDPNAALNRARDAADRIEGMTSNLDDALAYESAADEMASAFRDLDEWLGKGGFAPESWPLRPRRDLLAMEQRAFRLRNALLEAGVPENLVRAVELGGEKQEARAVLRTDAERRGRPYDELARDVYGEGPGR